MARLADNNVLMKMWVWHRTLNRDDWGFLHG